MLNGINNSTSAIRHVPMPPSAGSYRPHTNSPMLDGNDAKIMASQWDESSDATAMFLDNLRKQKEREKCHERGYNRKLLKGLDKRKINFSDAQQKFFDVKIEPTCDLEIRKKYGEPCFLDNFASLEQPNEIPFSIHESHHKANYSEDYFISAKQRKNYKNKILSQKLDKIKKKLCNQSKFLVSPQSEFEVDQSFLNSEGIKTEGIQTEGGSPNRKQQPKLPHPLSIMINQIPPNPTKSTNIKNQQYSQLISDAYFSDLDRNRKFYQSDTKKAHPLIKKSSITQKFLKSKNKGIRLLSDASSSKVNINKQNPNILPETAAFTPIKRTSQPSDQSNSSKPLDFKYKRRLHPRPASNKIMQLFSPHQFEKKVRSERDIQKQIHSRLNSQQYYTNASTKLSTSDQRSEVSLCLQPIMNNYNFSYQSNNQCVRQLIFQPPKPHPSSEQRVAQSHRKENLSFDQQIQKRSNKIYSASKADAVDMNKQTKLFQSEGKRNKPVRGGVNPSYLLTFGGDNSSHCSCDQLPAEFFCPSQQQNNSIDDDNNDDHSNDEIKFQQHEINYESNNCPYKTSNFGGKIKQDEISDYSTNAPALSINGQNINSPFRFNQMQQEKKQLVKYDDSSQSYISSQLINNNSRKLIQKAAITSNRHSCPEANNQSVHESKDQQIMQLALQSLTLE